MDFRPRSADERAAHYQREAEKFRKMAQAEPVERIRVRLADLAAQYQYLADSLARKSAWRG